MHRAGRAGDRGRSEAMSSSLSTVHSRASRVLEGVHARLRRAMDTRERAYAGNLVYHHTKLSPRYGVPATHSASLRAFTPVFDGLWTRVNALLLSRGAPRRDERMDPI